MLTYASEAAVGADEDSCNFVMPGQSFRCKHLGFLCSGCGRSREGAPTGFFTVLM